MTGDGCSASGSAGRVGSGAGSGADGVTAEKEGRAEIAAGLGAGFGGVGCGGRAGSAGADEAGSVGRTAGLVKEGWRVSSSLKERLGRGDGALGGF